VSTIKKLASQTAVYGLSQIVGRFVNYLLVPLHTALFATGDYGVNTLMYSYVTFFNVLLAYGMETAFFRFSQKSDDPNKVYSTALMSLLSTSVFFALLFSVASQPIANLIHIPEHPEFVFYFTLIISFDAISAIPFAYLRQHNKALKFAVIKNINIFTNILLNLYFLLLCPWVQKEYGILLPMYSGEIHIGYVFIANLFASLVTLPLLAKEFLAIRNASFDKALWKEMLVYALPLMVVGFAGMINETLDRIIISYSYDDAQKGLEATGIYGANYKLSVLMSLFIQAFRYAAEPFFFNQAKTNDKRTIYATVMNYFTLVCLSLFLFVMLYIDVFKYFINRNYWEGLHVVPVLLIANLFLGIYFNLSIWYKLSDHTNKGAVISLGGAAITIVANLILVPIYGYTGSAWATLICYVSMAFICYGFGAKYYPIPYQVRRFMGYFVLALAIYALSLWLKPLLSQNAFYQYTANALLLLGFAATAFLFERKNKILTSPN
jgi:O-antigen/teichoic acid export membrane protein